MKPSIFFVVVILLLSQCSDKRAQDENFRKEFAKNYNYLDSINKRALFDTTCRSSVRYVEKITGIKATQDGNFFGPTLFTTQDLEAWKKWSDDNQK